jgi:hypothetical protein
MPGWDLSRATNLRHALFFIILTLTVPAVQGQNPYVGAAACASCHPQQVRKQAGTHHANALQAAASSPFPKYLIDRQVRERSGTRFDYRMNDKNGLEVVVSQEQKTNVARIEWVFGAGALALTPVGKDDDGYFEHRVSWYSASQRPGMTLGHDPNRPPTPQAALGRRPKAEEITRCFGCHAAGVRPALGKGSPNLDWIQPGVQCERCHGPGRDHVQTPSRTNISGNHAPDAKTQVAFCAQCHRAPEQSLGTTPERADPMLVRFAPVGLSASRCFQASGRLTCLTCHDPHEDARQDAAFYSAVCQTCHQQPKHPEACAFVKTDCLSCHMPKRTPVQDLTFTDHRIRVVEGKR